MRPSGNGLALAAILLAALAFRAAAVGYGGPLLSLVPDEPGVVKDAAQLWRAPVPALVEDAQPTPYPLASLYLYAASYVPALSWLYATGDFDGRAAFVDHVLIDQTALFASARILSAVLGTLTVWVLYCTGLLFYRDRLAGLLCAALVAVNLLLVDVSHWGTVWPLANLLFALMLLCSLKLYSGGGSKGLYWACGVVIGLAAGTNIICALGGAFPIAAHCLRKGRQFLDRNLLRLVGSALVILVIFFALHPFAYLRYFEPGFKAQWGGAETDGGTYFEVVGALLSWIWSTSPVLAILGAVGLGGLAIRQRPLAAAAITATVLLWAVPLALFVAFEGRTRYASPLILVLALAAVLPVHRATRRLLARRAPWLVAGVLALTFLYPVAATSRHALLFLRPDTRNQALELVRERYSSDAGVIHLERTKPFQTERAVAIESDLEKRLGARLSPITYAPDKLRRLAEQAATAEVWRTDALVLTEKSLVPDYAAFFELLREHEARYYAVSSGVFARDGGRRHQGLRRQLEADATRRHVIESRSAGPPLSWAGYSSWQLFRMDSYGPAVEIHEFDP